MDLKLYPRPRSLRMGTGSTDLRGRVLVHLHADASERLRQAVRRWCDRIEALPQAGSRADRRLELTSGEAPPADLLLRISPADQALHAEGYRLTCGRNGLELTGADEAGIFYGLECAAQLLAQQGSSPRALRIDDHPDLAERGVMLDISRCKVPRLTTLKAYIEHLARLRINQLQLYTEHTFAFTNHRTVWRGCSPLTGSELATLDRFCRERYIELVPNLNSFGHFERWLRHPEYHHLAECPDGFDHPLGGRVPWGSTLRPTHASLALLRELFAEYLPHFTSTRFNIGCDEPWELGKGATRRRCEREGTSNVYVDFVSKVAGLVTRHGRTPMMWADILLRDPQSITRLPRDITLLNWGYEGDHPFRNECARLAAGEHPFLVCPGTSSWNSITGRSRNAADNLLNAMRNAGRFGASGCLITDWGDHGHHQYQPVSYAPLVLGASYAWNLRANRECDPADGVNRIFLDDPDSGLGAALLDLGRVEERLATKVPNSTVCNQLLFWRLRRAPPAGLESAHVGAIRECIDRVAEIGSRVRRARVRSNEAAMVRDEILAASAMARHGYERFLLSEGKLRSTRRLRADLERIIAEHRRLWLARNRPGGLAESAGRLRRSLAALPD